MHSPTSAVTSDLSIANIRHVLLAKPRTIAPPAPDRPLACVATVLAGDPERPSVCLIKRAQREGDPWSGHMAFPGGRADPTDASAEAVAEREAAEEVGLRLSATQLIAPLIEMPVRAGGREMALKLAAFVYHLDGDPPPLAPQTAEVAEALWVPLEHLYDPAHRTRYRMRRDGGELDFPGIGVGGYIVWGLTYRVLAELGERVGRRLPPN
jgi:8-oxo-dGTP pyrophosphatase MutT (NUDIX family)